MIISSNIDSWLCMIAPNNPKTGNGLRVEKNKGADQHAYPCSLSSAFIFRLLESIISRFDTSTISIF